ncbi:MAG: hypothetical protein EWM72_02250 [Nitrospira sp.]|nr:MAG: hypothetical protein EWM72_02250 [Nitrospira sp.]
MPAVRTLNGGLAFDGMQDVQMVLSGGFGLNFLCVRNSEENIPKFFWILIYFRNFSDGDFLIGTCAISN